MRCFFFTGKHNRSQKRIVLYIIERQFATQETKVIYYDYCYINLNNKALYWILYQYLLLPFEFMFFFPNAFSIFVGKKQPRLFSTNQFKVCTEGHWCCSFIGKKVWIFFREIEARQKSLKATFFFPLNVAGKKNHIKGGLCSILWESGDSYIKTDCQRIGAEKGPRILGTKTFLLMYIILWRAPLSWAFFFILKFKTLRNSSSESYDP